MPKIPRNEPRRLENLRSYHILDSVPEKEYDEITYLASQICGTPVSLITLIDEYRQWFKSHTGMPVRQSPKEISFCAHAINKPDEMMIVKDTRTDKRFYDNPVVTGPPHVVFYAGIPLVSPNGYALGTLCVGDNKPRDLSESQIRSLKALAGQLMKLLELRKKSIELENRNHDILEGIHYARKIQYSILPSKADIQKEIPGSFVYFRPKDIIGGDFHWLFRRDGMEYLAAIDCTGHGVPGALMAMTVHSLLNEIMLDGDVSEPGEILGTLHRKIYTSLQQSRGDNYAQDGCDMALCAIDFRNNMLKFSGARMDLYLSNGSEVTRLRGTPRSIGGLSLAGKQEARRTFETKTTPLEGEKLLILSTDGILDQLNKRNEHFGAFRFHNMVLEMCGLSVLEMNHLVRNEIKDWIGNTVQQDDMLLIGVLLKRKENER